jgi:Ceramidase
MNALHRTTTRAVVLTLFGVLAGIAVLTLDPIAQDPAYHRYADTRTLFGIPHAWNVLSNLALLGVGLAGLIMLGRLRNDPPRMPYLVMFTGVALTGIGSMYYHLAPDNDTLVWDRLPMTIGFAGFFCSVVAELVSRRLANALLGPLVLAGIGSVIYWIVTERAGAGDLRWYGLAQFLPMLLIPLLLVLYPRPARYTTSVVALLAVYAVSKLLEFLDTEIFQLGAILSGHTLKHFAAALALACLLPMLVARYRHTSTSHRNQ